MAAEPVIEPLALLSGFLLAALISLAAWRARTLSPSGGLGALALGTVIFGIGGLGWAILLLGFFVSSSLLSKLFKRRKAALNEKFSKGSRRDAWQVLANGGIAGLFALLHAFAPGAWWPWVGCAGALAAANADTWATELGVLSRSAPRLITTGKTVERGTSGGISGTGLLAALGGALLIALLGVLFWQGYTFSPAGEQPAWLGRLLGSPGVRLPLGSALLALGAVTLAGLVGSLVDSWLGATVQAIYFCPACQKETERYPLHTCGTQTALKRGWIWMDNDWVNTICTTAGAVIAILLAFLVITL